MLDLTGIIFSSVMMLMVIIRALQLDRTQPWFQTIGPREDPKAARHRPWQRRS
jgi:hypothetical protein